MKILLGGFEVSFCSLHCLFPSDSFWLCFLASLFHIRCISQMSRCHWSSHMVETKKWPGDWAVVVLLTDGLLCGSTTGPPCPHVPHLVTEMGSFLALSCRAFTVGSWAVSVLVPTPGFHSAPPEGWTDTNLLSVCTGEDVWRFARSFSGLPPNPSVFSPPSPPLSERSLASLAHSTPFLPCCKFGLQFARVCLTTHRMSICCPVSRCWLLCLLTSSLQFSVIVSCTLLLIEGLGRCPGHHVTPHNFLASSLAPTPLHSSHSGLFWFPKFILLSCLCICCSSCPCPLSVQGSSTCPWGLNPNITSVPSAAFLFSPPRRSYSQSGVLAVVFQELLLCTKSNFVTFSTLCCNWWLPVFFLAICESRHHASFFPVAGTPQRSSVGMQWVREECFPWKCQLPSSLCLEMIKSMASPKELPYSLPIPKYPPPQYTREEFLVYST